MHYSTWKTVSVLIVCLLGFVFALPNALPGDTAERLPRWLQPVTLGLDLQGGSHLLLEVDVDSVVKEHMTGLVESIRTKFRQERVRYADLGHDGTKVQVRVLDGENVDKARQMLREIDPQIDVSAGDGGNFVLTYQDQALVQRRNSAVEQSLEVVRRRIDELGTREPTIQRQGADRIVVQLPGLKDPGRIRELLGKTAKLSFHLIDDSTPLEEALRGRVPPGSEVLPNAEKKSPEDPPSYVVRKRVEVGGDNLTDSQPSFQDAEPVVSFRFDTVGARRFGDATKANVGRRLAIVLDGKVISAPVIREPIMGGSGIISGKFTVQAANDLALLLRAGALPAPMNVLEERTVGPDLGADSIRAGAIASGVGLVLVMLFMVAGYGLFGWFANVALIVNLVLLMALLSVLGATLTLPGIAGIVLTMGMAVDANVLIYERMREEYRNGRTLINAMQAGFERALVTILDSNLTTLLAAGLLFWFGAGPIRGFAVTLTLGLFTSMFTAVMVTRLLLVLWIKRARPKHLPIEGIPA